MKKMIFWCLLLVGLAAVVSGCGNEQKVTGTVRVAAAASLEKVFTEKLIPLFNKQYPEIKVEGVYDGSGKLQVQIEEGLAADIFISASEKQMKALLQKKIMQQETVRPLLENKLVLIVAADAQQHIAKFEDLTKVKHPVIGDPKSVPAGQYAQEALSKLGVWEQVSSKASLGTNVTEVLHWVAEGSADAGIVYATDAASNNKVKVAAVVPTGVLQKPVIYPMGMLAKAPHADDAKKFYEFLHSAQASVIFKEAGFEIAG